MDRQTVLKTREASNMADIAQEKLCHACFLKTKMCAEAKGFFLGGHYEVKHGPLPIGGFLLSQAKEHARNQQLDLLNIR